MTEVLDGPGSGCSGAPDPGRTPRTRLAACRLLARRPLVPA